MDAGDNPYPVSCRFEMVKQVHLMIDPFDSELITPTLKLKRNLVAKAFKSEIEDMYNSYVTPAKL